MDECEQLIALVSAIVTDPLIELPVQGLERRHPQHHLASRGERLVDVAECPMIVGNVFEDVEEYDRVVRARRRRTVELGRDHDGVRVLQPLPQRSTVRFGWFERGEVSVVGEIRREGAPTGADLENAAADVRTDQVEDPRRVVLRLLELLENLEQILISGVECGRCALERSATKWVSHRGDRINSADERTKSR